MAVFKFVSGGSLIVETSDDPAYPVKAFTETIDTWAPAGDTGRRRMPRDVGRFVRFRDSVSGQSTDWLDFVGNMGSWGYAAKDSAGFWNVHVGTYLHESSALVDPPVQSSTH